VKRLRGDVKTEVNRVVHRLVAVRKPAVIGVERLRFSSPELSRRLNRIVQNRGQAVVAAKLVSLKQELGIESREVHAAYTSQKCSSCGYVDRRNRRGARFACRFCGLKLDADVNAARNVGQRRSLAVEAARRTRREILDGQTRLFSERYGRLWSNPWADGTRRVGAPAAPRLSNPYFAEQVAVARSSGSAPARAA
jgi:putative transposase